MPNTMQWRLSSSLLPLWPQQCSPSSSPAEALGRIAAEQALCRRCCSTARSQPLSRPIQTVIRPISASRPQAAAGIRFPAWMPFLHRKPPPGARSRHRRRYLSHGRPEATDEKASAKASQRSTRLQLASTAKSTDAQKKGAAKTTRRTERPTKSSIGTSRSRPRPHSRRSFSEHSVQG